MDVMETIVGVAQAAVSPINKLIDTVRAATWTYYQPRHVVKMADAHAKAISAIAEAERLNPDTGVHTQVEGLTVSNLDPQSVEYRARVRNECSIIKRQVNLENVLKYAEEEINQKSFVSPEPVAQDWTNRFIGIVEEVSDEDIQRVWAKILAGEVETPNSYSKRTLEVLANMSRKEAAVFEKVAPYILCLEDDYYLIDCTEIDSDFNLPKTSDILILQDAMIINSSLISIHAKTQEEEKAFFYTKEYASRLVPCGDGQGGGYVRAYKLTNAGKELLSIIQTDSDLKSMKMLFNYISGWITHAKISLHKISRWKEDGNVTIDTRDLLKEEA